jgi:hypothetical protein
MAGQSSLAEFFFNKWGVNLAQYIDLTAFDETVIFSPNTETTTMITGYNYHHVSVKPKPREAFSVPILGYKLKQEYRTMYNFLRNAGSDREMGSGRILQGVETVTFSRSLLVETISSPANFQKHSTFKMIIEY